MNNFHMKTFLTELRFYKPSALQVTRRCTPSFGPHSARCTLSRTNPSRPSRDLCLCQASRFRRRTQCHRSQTTHTGEKYRKSSRGTFA